MDWFALHCRSCTESIVTAKLVAAGIETYFPHRIVISPRRERKMEVPVFTGYTFGYFDQEHRLKVAQISQVVRVLGAGPNPICIAPSEIAAIKIMVDAPVVIEPCQFLNAGDRVRVKFGPLVGLEGCVLHWKKKAWVVCSLNGLERSIKAEVDPLSLEFIGHAQAA